MKTNKQISDFLYIGTKILDWYHKNARILPWRSTKNPYFIWISEIILQQTQVKQGLNYYLKFVERFPNVQTLANADIDGVLLYWKGLGYYSRALNLHTAAKQIVEDFDGKFPETYSQILKLKGVGLYTAAAIASICFDEKIPAVDGNFYRILSRIFADDYDISKSNAFKYFSELALKIMPDYDFGNFNQAIMDLGSEVCKPKNPQCEVCPISEDCLAFSVGKMKNFPVKLKRVKSEELHLKYFVIFFENQLIIKQRDNSFIWKRLYDFPTFIPNEFEDFIISSTEIKHKLTHKNLNISINIVELLSEEKFKNFAKNNNFMIIEFSKYKEKTFPKPLEKFLEHIQLK